MKATRLQLALAFLCIYTVWGSTYLAIRIAVSTIPPFLMGGVRFIIAGSILIGWTRWRGAPRPSRQEWTNATIIGALLLLIGNGAVAWSEQRVSSGLTSLLVATTPVWLVLIETRNGRRPELLQWVGVAVGLGGVGLLVMPGDNATGVSPTGALVLIAGSLSWAAGSMFSRTAQLANPPSMASGMQMLCGGGLLLMAAAISGEFSGLHVHTVSNASLLALLYLIVIGSLVGFSTYMWLLKAASPAAVGTYSYVNPVVAVLLGVVIGGESLPPSALAAMFVIVGSVALISLIPYLRTRIAEAG